MNAAAASLLIILLSNDGHWLSGTDGEVTVRWSAEAAGIAAGPCELAWEMRIGDVRLGSQRVAMEPRQAVVVANITCPDVRTRLRLRWDWRLVRKADGKELASGSESVVAYPADELTRGWRALLHGKRVIVVDRAGGLPALLQGAKVKFERIDTVSQLQVLAGADAIIIGEGMLRPSAFEQAPLAGLRRAGAAVAVFRQSEVDHVLEYALVTRARPRGFDWESQNPLLEGFDGADMRSLERQWATAGPRELRAVRVPAGEAAADAVVSWQTSRPWWLRPPFAARCGDVDALLMSHPGGGSGAAERRQGRLVLCQLPLGPWSTDPRSQMLLGNILDLLVSPPAMPSVASKMLATPATTRDTVTRTATGVGVP